jgi:hypothetical protein
MGLSADMEEIFTTVPPPAAAIERPKMRVGMTVPMKFRSDTARSAPSSRSKNVAGPEVGGGDASQ